MFYDQFGPLDWKKISMKISESWREPEWKAKGYTVEMFRIGYNWARGNTLCLALFSLLSFVRYAPQFGKRKTYCPLLWDSVYIDDHGHVFPCCHVRPGMIGNLYKKNLQDIWARNVALKLFRWMSFHGCLYCSRDCDLVTSKEKKGPACNPLPMRYPKSVQIMYGELCNLDCIMCRQNHRSKVKMDNSTLQKNIDWSEVQEIALQGGEILGIKEGKELWVWLTQQMDKKVNLITNGTLVNDEWAENLVRGAKWIAVSVNAAKPKTHEMVNRGSSFERVINNLRKLVALKRKLGCDTQILFKYTIVPENINEIVEAITLADTIGCDGIKYGHESSVPGFLARNTQIRQEIRCSLNSLIHAKDLMVRVDFEVLAHLGLME